MELTQPNYDAWLINEKDFPKNGTIEDKIWFIVGYGILAPSTHNTQPWQFEVDDNTLVINHNEALSLSEADPSGRNLQISLGACVTNISVAASFFDLKPICTWEPHVIHIKFEAAKHNSSQDKLFKAITNRFSAKMPYMSKTLKEEHKDKLLQLRGSGCNLELLTNKSEVQQAAKIQAAATLGYKANRLFFKELSSWLRPSKTRSEDGMPGFVVGLSNGKSKVFKPMIRKFKPIVKLLAKKDYQAVVSSSAVAFITTKDDKPEEWFNAGQYYEMLALQATAIGVSMTPLAALIENNAQRTNAIKTLKLSDKPQIFFRIGYSKHKPYHTPRRKVASFNMETQQRLAKELGISYQTKNIKIGRYDLNYVVAGGGKRLLMLHGANIGWAQWFQNIAEFSKYFTVYVLDMPGAGSSTKVNFNEMDFEKDYLRTVDEFIKKMKLDNLDIVGSSFGGWIALKLAIEKKPYIDKVVLTNPLGFTTHMPVKFRPVSLRPFALFMSKTALKPVRKNKNLEKFMRDVFYNKDLPLPKTFIDYFYELSKTSHNILFISRLAHITGMHKELFLGEELKKISNPVLVIWGKEDPLMPYKTVEHNIHLIPKVQLETLEKVGHMPPVEVPDKFNKLALAFLRDR